MVLDFETYFDETYKLDGIVDYITDRRFEVLGLSRFTISASLPFREVKPNVHMEVGEADVERYIKYLKSIYGPNLERCTVVLQNAMFDASVLAIKYNLHPKYIIDTLGLARAWHTRSKHGLAALAEKFGLPAKGDTKQLMGCTMRRRFVVPKGRGKHRPPPFQRPLMTDAQIGAMVEYANHDVELTWEVFTRLLPLLSNPAVELRIADLTLRLFTQPVLAVDESYGQQLIEGMNAELAKTLEAVGATHEEISGTNSFDAMLTTALQEAGDNPQQYCKVMKKGWVFGLAKDDPERKLLEAHASERVRQLMTARTGIKSWPLHISRIQGIMAMAKALGDKMPVPLKYHGAHTGRDSGSESINLQNLPKRGHKLVVAMRGLLIAPPDHELVIVDLSAIEARVLAWIAGQWDLMDKFAAGEEIYCGFASKVLGWPVRKPRKTGIPAVEARYTWARNNIGKIGILGCGYGMGAKEPGSTPPGPNYFFRDAGLDLEMATKIVNTYRDIHTEITGFWRAVEKAFAYTAKYRKSCSMERGLTFSSTADVGVVLSLPNGRNLNYHQIKIEIGQHGEDRLAVYNEVTHSHDHLWGGVITENIVQAISRDILMETMIRLEDLGHHTVHRIHDELVIVARKGEGQQVLDVAIKEMSRTPSWGQRLPLAAEGVVSERYGLH